MSRLWRNREHFYRLLGELAPQPDARELALDLDLHQADPELADELLEDRLLDNLLEDDSCRRCER